MDNPFYISAEPTSLEAANAVQRILGGEVLDNSKQWNATVFGEIPPKAHYSLKVNDAKPQKICDLVYFLNTYSPSYLRVALNEVGITTLGPPPLPCLVSYQCNYDRDPLATDPGPVPTWAKVREAALKVVLKVKGVSINGKK